MAKKKVKRRAVLATYIYDSLRQDISGGKVGVGEHVASEHELCKRFKASRMTIRAGLKRLAADGLIKSVPGRGWEVTSDTPRKRPITAKPVLLSGSGSHDCALCLESARRALQRLGHRTAVHARSRDTAIGEIEWDAISGLIYYTGAPIEDDIVKGAARAKVPLVAAMLSQQEDYDTVSCDHHASTVECMDYLIDNGMRRIGYLSNGFLEDASNDPSFRQRRAAYDAAIAKLGEEPRVFMSKYNHAIGFEDGDRFAEWIASFGRKPPDALFVTVKPLVEFALWQMHKHGISAKTGIRIVGATESIPRSLLEIHKLKKITLVRAPFERIGELAAKRVAERIDGDDGPAHCTLLKAELLEVEGDEEAFEV